MILILSVAMLVFSLTLAVGLLAYKRGQHSVLRDRRSLRELLGEREPTLSGPGRGRAAALEDALVRAGWRHERFVSDPEHYDEAGRYLWWGC